MKPKFLIGMCLLIVVAGAYFLKVHSSTDHTSTSTPPEIQVTAEPEMTATTETDIFAKALAEANQPSSYVLSEQEREKIMKIAVAQALEVVGKSESLGKQIEHLLECPVEIYGQVLDQNGTPVAGSKIKYSTLPSGPMIRVFNVMSSAPEGRFEVKDLKALGVTLTIEPPPGYQQTAEYVKDIAISEPLEVIQLSEEYKKLPQAARLAIAPYLSMGRPNLPAYKPDREKPLIFWLTKL